MMQAPLVLNRGNDMLDSKSRGLDYAFELICKRMKRRKSKEKCRPFCIRSLDLNVTTRSSEHCSTNVSSNDKANRY